MCRQSGNTLVPTEKLRSREAHSEATAQATHRRRVGGSASKARTAGCSRASTSSATPQLGVDAACCLRCPSAATRHQNVVAVAPLAPRQATRSLDLFLQNLILTRER